MFGLIAKGLAMIAIEVRLNGKYVCVAGADDLALLSAHVTAVGKLGKKTFREKTADIPFYVGGLTGRRDSKKDVHLKWKVAPLLKVGDVVQFKILNTEKVDRATSSKRTKNINKIKQATSFIDQAAQACWLALPKDRRSVVEIEKKIRRIMKRALAKFRQDATSFGHKA
jgi:hypothetical protein